MIKKIISVNICNFNCLYSGAIYIAFGTHADWNYAPKRIVDALFGAFERLTEYRIIFVYNGDIPPKIGSHIRLVKWAPQLELLAHPKIILFITHGGLKRFFLIF